MNYVINWKKGQQYLFSFTIHYALHSELAKMNSELKPRPFQIFSSGAAGIPKSFLITVMTEYLKWVRDIQIRTLINHLFLGLHLLEKLLQVSMALHCILHFMSLLRQAWNPPSIKGQVMKLWLILESIVNRWNINDRKENLWTFWCSVKSYHAKFVNICWSFFVSSRRFFSTSTCLLKSVLMKSNERFYRSFNGWLWKKFQLHEQVKIVWQTSDSVFAQLLNFEKVSKQIMTWSKENL